MSPIIFDPNANNACTALRVFALQPANTQHLDHLDRSSAVFRLAITTTTPTTGSKRKASFPEAPQGWARQKLVRIDREDEDEELDDWTDDDSVTIQIRDTGIARPAYPHRISAPRIAQHTVPAASAAIAFYPPSALRSVNHPHAQKHARFSACAVCHRQQNLFTSVRAPTTPPMEMCSVCGEDVCAVCSRKCQGVRCGGTAARLVCRRCCIERYVLVYGSE